MVLTTAETIVAVDCKVVFADIVSPSVNADEVLFVPEFIYLTSKVFGSDPSVATVLTTLAFKPEEAPVKVKPTKSDNTTQTEAESVNEVHAGKILECYFRDYGEGRLVLANANNNKKIPYFH